MSRPVFADAVHIGEAGLFLDLEATPGAREDRFPDGYNAWRHRIGVRVTAPPEDGKANKAVVRVVASFFGVATGAVTLTAGSTSREKRVHVAGITFADALARLGTVIA